jgi:hypothetical protein
MRFITTYFTLWPGGKAKADSLVNSVSDNVMSLLGWFLSRYIDSLSSEHHLYP